MSGFLTIDGTRVPIEGEKNLLALCRKANIDIPTFCYHSALSAYGACRLCLVEIDGKSIDASCVVPPKDGMSIRTNTAKLRSMRRMNLELLLANHKQDCPSCERSASCRLRDLSVKMGIRGVRFKNLRTERPLDTGSPALVRDPNKCILCGDCVRYCSEIQGIGAIDFVHRGSEVVVSPAFGKSLGDVDCVNCGQCAAVCPTAAIVPRSHVDEVWAALDGGARVVAQVAPAVRVALGERFGLPAGTDVAGKIAAALRMMGFHAVYDTAFGADLTVVEEAAEFLKRATADEDLPLFTSCCPAWVKFAEQLYPQLLPRLSSCMSPQSMMGSIIREDEARRAGAAAAPTPGAVPPAGAPPAAGGPSSAQPAESGAGSIPARRATVVVSIMPCTAKKYEIARPELSRDGSPLVDYALTTAELASMLEEAGIRFADLEPSSMDLPLGFASGSGLVFGNAGGVSEAVARYLAGGMPGASRAVLEFVDEIPGGGIRNARLAADGRDFVVTSVQGLANATRVVAEILSGARVAHLVEVMACPGGCIGGAGQPIDPEGSRRVHRARGLREAGGAKDLSVTGDNPFVARFYAEVLEGPVGGPAARRLLHTRHSSKKRIRDVQVPLVRGTGHEKVAVKVCVGTSCFLKGSQALLSELLGRAEAEGLAEFVDVSATFCSERCDSGPTVRVGDEAIGKATIEKVMAAIERKLEAMGATARA